MNRIDDLLATAFVGALFVGFSTYFVSFYDTHLNPKGAQGIIFVLGVFTGLIATCIVCYLSAALIESICDYKDDRKKSRRQ